MRNIIFTFIIPHYRIPELLQRCLSTIPQREDVQVIVVDDGSPDYDSYRARFPDMFCHGVLWVHAPRHGGAGFARNLGLNRARGKWVLFADADDFFSDSLPGFLDDNQDAHEDVIFYRNKCVMSNHPEEPSDRSGWTNHLFDRFAETGDIQELMFNHLSPWGKMINRKFLTDHQIKFDEIPYSNDVLFSTLIASKAKKVRVIDQCIYFLTERKGSLTSDRMLKPGELSVRADAATRAQVIANKSGYRSLYFPLSHYLYKMLYRDRKLFREFFKRIPDVYPSFWIPVKEMARNESSRFRKAFVYTYSVYTFLTIR